MPKRNPVSYVTNGHTFTLSPIRHTWAIDRYLPKSISRYATDEEAIAAMIPIMATHQVNTTTASGINLVIGYLAFRQDTKEWNAYDDASNYVLTQSKLLLSFAQLCERAYTDLHCATWEI